MTTHSDVARRLAAKVFAERGGKSEAHLSQRELEAIILIAVKLSHEIGAVPDVVAECER